MNARLVHGIRLTVCGLFGYLLWLHHFTNFRRLKMSNSDSARWISLRNVFKMTASASDNVGRLQEWGGKTWTAIFGTRPHSSLSIQSAKPSFVIAREGWMIAWICFLRVLATVLNLISSLKQQRNALIGQAGFAFLPFCHEILTPSVAISETGWICIARSPYLNRRWWLTWQLSRVSDPFLNVRYRVYFTARTVNFWETAFPFDKQENDVSRARTLSGFDLAEALVFYIIGQFTDVV